MKSKILVFLFTLVVLFGSNSCKTETKLDSSKEETLLDISYGDDLLQTFDIFLPANRSATKTKVIVLIHGGGWIEGDKGDIDFLIPYLKSQHPNHAILNVNYSLATTESPAFPNQFLDLKNAIEKITEEKETLQILPEFGLIGISAGAHIAMVYDYKYDTDNKVKFVCDIIGPSDFTDPFYKSQSDYYERLANLTDESAYPEGTEYAKTLSPAFMVNKNSSPTLLFYADKDTMVPLSNAKTLELALKNKNIEHRLSIYHGGHGDNWSEETNHDIESQMSEFINKYLAIKS